MKKASKLLALVLCLTLLLGSVAVFTAAEEEPLRYVVLGDSIGRGAGVRNSSEACYGRIVADTNGYDYVNYAVDGYRTTNLLALLDRETVAADVAAADIISLSIGGNDFLLGNLPAMIFDATVKGDYTKFDEVTARFYTNFCAIIAKIKALNPDAVLLAQTLYNPRYDSLRDAYQQGADRLNNAFLRYLEENPGAYVLVDVGTAFEGKEEYIAADTIHPSVEGNLVIARLVLAALYDLGLGETTEPLLLHEGLEAPGYNTKLLFMKLRRFFASLLDKLLAFLRP